MSKRTKIIIEETSSDGTKRSVAFDEKGKIVEVKKTTSSDGCGCCGCITVIIFLVGFFTILGWIFNPT